MFRRLVRIFGLASLLVCGNLALAGTITSSPTTCANVDRGYPAWSNPGNAVSSNDSYATVDVNDNTTSDYLRCTGFNLNVPAGATITGFTVTIERRASDTLARDETVSLVKTTTPIGTNKAVTASDYPTGNAATSDAVATYGSYNDLWGSTWTVAEANGANFGVALAVRKYGTQGGSRTVSLDHIQVTVHYTSPCVAPSNIPAGITVECHCDDFNRTSLDGSPFFTPTLTNWSTNISDGTGIQPVITTPGFLRMTNNTGNNAKAATIPGVFPAAGNYISVEFDYYAYDGSNADGIAITLSDYTQPAVPGAFGGSLGFAQKSNPGSDCTTVGGCPGFAGGWVGIGIDEFGNYQNANEGRCGAYGTGGVPMVGVRGSGSGQTGYCWLRGSGALANIAAGSSKTRAPGHRYQVIVDARNAAASQTFVTVNRDTAGSGTYTALVPSFDAFAQGYTQAVVPAHWKISFTGSTGGATNIHEIGNVRVCAQTVVPPTGGTASGFSAIDEAYSQVIGNFLDGHIFMKVVGQPFKLSVAALSNNQIQTGYALTSSKNVTVKLVNQGIPTDSDYCNINATCSASCKSKAAVTGGTQTLTFVAADLGKKQTANFTINTAYQSLVAVIDDGTVSACAIDAFSVRPLSFQPLTTTTATNLGTTGLPRFKAGSDQFSITAITNGIAGSPSGYRGVPKINNAALSAVAPATVAGQISGTFPAATSATPSSTSTGITFTYSEVGAFTIGTQGVYEGVLAAECGPTGCDGLKTGSWTGVDSISTKGDCVNENFSNVKDANGKYGCLFGTTGPTSFGRFTPDHFGLAAGSIVTPACVGVAGFTYMDQPFNQLRFDIEAQNAGNNRTQNYAGTATVTVVAENANSGTALSARVTGVPTATWAAGAYSVNTSVASFRRRTVAIEGTADPDGPYDTLQLGVSASDEGGTVTMGGMNMRAGTSGACTTNTAPATDCDSSRLNDAAGVAQPSIVRFGRLRMMNAHGSERLNLPIPITAQYWNGTFFVTNTLDNCTAFTANNIGFMEYNGSVTNANMGVGNVVLGGGGQFSSGVGSLRLTTPNQAGSVDICIDLGADTPVAPARCTATSAAMPWLQGMWVNATYIDDPRVRASFGIYKSEFIYLREMY